MKTLFVSFQGYHKDSGVAKYADSSLIQMLINIHEKHLYGVEDEELLDEQKLIDEIDKVNGDGCDYIISIITSTGEILYECAKNK